MEIFFMIDICLNFVTGYYKKGNVIMKRGPIFKHYLRTWFFLDFIATVPITWFLPEKKIDYWPDDDFDEIEAETAGGIFMNLAVETNKFAAFADFDLN